MTLKSTAVATSEAPQAVTPPPQATPLPPTPHQRNTGTDLQGHKDLEALKDDLMAEMKGHWVEGDLKWVESMFTHTRAVKTKIKSFLTKSRLYNSKKNRWTEVPSTAREEKVLYKPLVKILNAVLHEFDLHSDRNWVDTHDQKLEHHTSGVENPLKSSPDLTLGVKGPHIGPQSTVELESKSYSMGGTVIEVKRHEIFHLFRHRGQISTYVHALVAGQPNRLFCYALQISEKHLQVYHYSRTGVVYSGAIDYHKDADLFIRIILTICSRDARQMGYNTDWSWNRERSIFRERYVPPSPEHLTSRPELSQFYNCAVKGQSPFARSAVIRGRAGTCWLVPLPSGDWGCIKETWHDVSRVVPEYCFVILGKDLAGVGQMIGYEIVYHASKFRGEPGWTSDDGHNTSDRMLIRLYLPAYYGKLDEFKTRHELLRTMRGALVGHKNMYCVKGVLHRDISKGNIMRTFGADKNGYWGRLIDFDMAAFTFRTDDNSRSERTGTRIFESINVLSHHQLCGEHDCEDDMESFFWVLMFNVLSRWAPGQWYNRHSAMLALWNDKEVRVAQKEKLKFLENPIPTEDYLSPYWSHKPFVAILNQFRFWCLRTHHERKRTKDLADAAAEHDRVMAVLERANAPATPPVTADSQATSPTTPPASDNSQGAASTTTSAEKPPFNENSLKTLYTDDGDAIIAQKAERAKPVYEAVEGFFESAMQVADALDKEVGQNVEAPPAAAPTGNDSPSPEPPEPKKDGKRKTSARGGSRKVAKTAADRSAGASHRSQEPLRRSARSQTQGSSAGAGPSNHAGPSAKDAPIRTRSGKALKTQSSNMRRAGGS